MVQVFLVLDINTRADAETIATAIKNKFAGQLDHPKIVRAELKVVEQYHLNEFIKSPA